ncbi:MAG: 50S ribosomal protein L29 [Saprospiraceae bacterium]
MAKEKLDVAGMTEEGLQTELASMEREYQTMKFDHTVKGLSNPLELRELRRDIARINTEARSRELVAMSPEELELRSKLRARRRRQK